MIRTLAVQGYRSLRHLVIDLAPLTVITGANGSGKSSLYRSLRLLADSSRNGAIPALAREGGLESTLWAGPEHGVRGDQEVQGTRRTAPVSLKLGFAGDEYGYAMDLGLPVAAGSMFDHDPEIKVEVTWTGPVLRPATLLAERRAKQVRFRDPDGGWYGVPYGIPTFDSMLSEVADPQRAPELLQLRERMRAWRFYDHLRTDAAAPARTARIATRTPILGHDGADLAAALQTISEIGDADALEAAIDDAFPGSRLEIHPVGGGRLEPRLRQYGLLRPLSVAELSDGTLRYLLWAAALLTPRPPELLVLNEPETSLHPDLLEPLAALIGTAADHAQVVVVTHAEPLVKALEQRKASTVELVKAGGETTVAGRGNLEEPLWYWPKR